MRIFVSYRHDETSAYAGRLADGLVHRFGREQVFIDVAAIELGAPFPSQIADAIASCDVLIAVIGRRWLCLTDADGRRRLDDRRDYVRLEIETALRSGIRVVPVRVQGADFPSAQELPATLGPMTLSQGFELHDQTWPEDVATLCRRLEGRAAEIDPPATSHWLPGIGLVGRLPPLEWEARPGIAATVGTLLGGFGAAAYFRTLPDVVVGVVLLVPVLVAGLMAPETDVSSDVQSPWWALALTFGAMVLSGVYSILRAYSSNQRLEGRSHQVELAFDERSAALLRRLQTLTSQGWKVESQTGFGAIVSHRVPNHVLHAILTWLSCGLWAVVWITLSVRGGEKRRALSIDAWGNVHTQRIEPLRRAGPVD